MFDRILMLLEIILLIWIVWQGEGVKFYEKETWRMNAERFEERKQWRLQKKQQQVKKSVPDAILVEKLTTSDAIKNVQPTVMKVCVSPVGIKTNESGAKTTKEKLTLDISK